MKIKTLLFQLTVFFQAIMWVLLIFESAVSIPYFIQPLGRMHPLVLHFPIVLVILLTLLYLFKKKFSSENLQELISLIFPVTVFLTTLTAFMGVVLSAEGGYAGNDLDLHKWGGIGVSLLLLLGITIEHREKAVQALMIMSSLVIIFTGHFGANLTHGSDFLLEPLKVNQANQISDDDKVYHAWVSTVLESKCMSCHNPSKKKGQLDLSSFATLVKGGESGNGVVEGDINESVLFQRMALPKSHEDHMPPEGKPQLNESEFQLIRSWITLGADTLLTVGEMKSIDSLSTMVVRLTKSSSTEKNTYDFPFADSDIIEELNTPYVTVSRITPSSPALTARIFVRSAFDVEFLKSLQRVAEQIVELNLSFLPVTDEHLALLSPFKNLETLILNYSDITGSDFTPINELTSLQELGLTGTDIEVGALDQLKEHPGLREVYVWHTSVSENNAETGSLPFNVNKGFDPENAVPLKLSTPLLSDPVTVVKKGHKVDLTHKIPDVEIYYTWDGSEPDSTATLFSESLVINTPVVIKAIAKKEGWFDSEMISKTFFLSGLLPQSSKLLEDPHENYPGKGSEALNDGEKGDIVDFRSGRWLGYQDTPFDVIVDFGNEPKPISKIAVGYGRNMSSYIMDPIKGQVWGGNDPDNMKLLATRSDPIPSKLLVNEETFYELTLPRESKFRYYRIKVFPVTKLPDWHPGAGDKGWVFVDEVFYY